MLYLNHRRQPGRLLALTFTLVGLVSWNPLQFHRQRQAVRAAIQAGANQLVPGAAANGKIAFVSERDGNAEIYTINADGTGTQRLATPTSVANGKIAFSRSLSISEVHLVNADGSNQKNLTNSQGFDGVPVWSPDGSRIAFESGRDGNGDIYVMNADGSNPKRLADPRTL